MNKEISINFKTKVYTIKIDGKLPLKGHYYGDDNYSKLIENSKTMTKIWKHFNEIPKI